MLASHTKYFTIQSMKWYSAGQGEKIKTRQDEKHREEYGQRDAFFAA
jgi:hypothetical protein